MPGPLWLGVGGTLHRRRARGPLAPRPRSPRRPADPWLTFVVATLTLSWLTIAAVGPLTATTASPLDAALRYVCLLGWQPVVVTAALGWLGVAVPSPQPPPLRVPRVLEALGVIAGGAAAAAVVAWLAGEPGALPALGSPGTLVAATILIGQAALEEHGWRGAALDWAVARWGRPRGLLVHAVAWALGYAPLGIAAAPALAPTIALVATLLTATAIGVMLGALRLRGGRVVPAALANAAMTIAAGVPMVLVAA